MVNDLKNLAVKVFGMTEEQVQNLVEKTDEGKETLKSNFVDELSKADKQRIDRIKNEMKDSHKNDLTEIHDKGYNKAKKEERSKFEEDIRKEFGAEDLEKQGIDLIRDIMAQQKSDKDIKTHPDYIALEKKLTNEYVPKKDFEKVQQDFDSFKQGAEREKTLHSVKKDADTVMQEINPILPKNPKAAKNQKEMFFKNLEDYNYQLDEAGNHIILKPDGTRLETEHGNPVEFKNFVKNKTQEFFDIADQGKKGSSGVETSENGGSSQPATEFKDYNDFMSQYGGEKDEKKRIDMYKAAQSQGLV